MAIAITEAGSAGRTVAALLADEPCRRNAMRIPVARHTGASRRERQGPYPRAEEDGRVVYVHVGDFAAPFNAASSVPMVDGEAVTDGEDVSAFPPCWTPDGELFYVADGQVKVRRPGTAQSAPEQIPFTASLSLSRPEYRQKRYDFNSLADREVRGIHLPVLSPDGKSVSFAALNALW